MNTFDFHNQLTFSQEGYDFPAIIKDMLPGTKSVEKASLEDDLHGVDYWATLRNGAKIGIDIKLRAKGCSQFWTNCTPEIALENYSNIPNQNNIKGKVGWTLDESKITDYTLHIFDKSDTPEIYLLPCQLLRKAFITNYSAWKTRYGETQQKSESWIGSCVFVPIDVVRCAIILEMSGKQK